MVSSTATTMELESSGLVPAVPGQLGFASTPEPVMSPNTQSLIVPSSPGAVMQASTESEQNLVVSC